MASASEVDLAVPTDQRTWAAQDMRLPVSWYESIEAGSGVGYQVSGDATARYWPPCPPYRGVSHCPDCSPINYDIPL